MDINLLFIKVVILLLPGCISMFIWQTFSDYHPVNSRKYMEGIILFSLTNYIIVDFFMFLYSFNWKFYLISSLLSEEYVVPQLQVVFASLVSVAVGFIFQYRHNHDLVFSKLRKHNYISIYNNQNLWDSYFIQKNKSKDGIQNYNVISKDDDLLDNHILSVYDKKSGITYIGLYYSSNVGSDLREIILEDVKAMKGHKIVEKYKYSYISFDNNDIVINFMKKE